MINTPIPNTTRAPTRANTRTKPNPGMPGGLDVNKLEELLADLEREHEHLLTLAGEQRDAITRADPKGLGQVVEQTASTLGRIAGIEHSRQQIIKRQDGTIQTIDQITAQLREQHNHQLATTLTNRAQSLRSLMHRVNDEHEAVRQASLALSNHMTGLINQVGAKLSYTGTYGRRGAVDPARSQVVSSLDTVH